MTGVERDCARCLQRSALPHSLLLTATIVKRRAWASTMFSGVRLTAVVTGNDDDALDGWLIALPDLDLPLPGYFAADAEVVERGANAATIELLLLED